MIAAAADRLTEYRACLAQADHPSRFYHASFGVDPINVSRTLLHWRAVLHEHGWDGTFATDAPPRLRDLADVEALARARVPLDRGQRVQRATAALAQRRTQIDAVVLLDTVDELPPVWQALLDKLGFSVDPGVTPEPLAADGTDLRIVQQILTRLVEADTGAVPTKTQLRGDGTFVVLRGASRDITAQAVAECVIAAADGQSHDDALLIAEHDGVILDNACERAGLPRAGFQHYSQFRAVSQVLKLGLSLLWRPVSPQLLLQFLIHPVGPLRRSVRSALADAVADQPGIGGRRWLEARSDIAQRMREGGAEASEIAAVDASIDTWLGGERFDPALGAPIAALAKRAQLCSTYLAIRASAIDDDAERGSYINALAQSEALLRTLRALSAQGQTRVNRIDLDRLIDEIASAAPDPNTFAQAHHVRATTDPATVTQPWRRVYWWDLAAPSRDAGYPWSPRELEWLRAHGIALPDVAQTLRTHTRHWLRPILHAREHLTLVVHDSEHGYHPLWTQIANSFDGFTTARIDDVLLGGLPLPDIGIAARPLPINALPAPRRWWRLPKDVVLPRRPVESYSSLSKLFAYPHGYVLRYCAQLRPGRAQDLSDGNRLSGNLAHRLIERFFETNPLWAMFDARAVQDWFANELPMLLETEGAVLLEPGRGVDKQRVTATLRRALVALIDHLRDADIQTVQTEFHDEATFKSIRLGGDIDLLLTDPLGREIVLDVKWGSEQWRADDLRKNRHVQLAMYAYLRRARRQWPRQAYFIIESGRILAQEASVFPAAVLYPPENGESIDDLWRRIGVSHDWRWRQLGKGLVEVNVANTAPTDDSMPPDGALAAVGDPDQWDDFVNLTGWADYE